MQNALLGKRNRSIEIVKSIPMIQKGLGFLAAYIFALIMGFILVSNVPDMISQYLPVLIGSSIAGLLVSNRAILAGMFMATMLYATQLLVLRALANQLLGSPEAIWDVFTRPDVYPKMIAEFFICLIMGIIGGILGKVAEVGLVKK